MSLPTIIVDSATGSDSAASGAGPGDGTTAGSALTGTAASTSGTGLVVTLDSGTVLTAVDTTGLHVLYLVDATAGARNFGKITATSGSGGATPTVTVSSAFGLSLSGKSWAIGGKRATIAGTASLKLFDNNGAAGDAMPGWAVEMQSGHAETLSSGLNLRRAGDTTSGPITLRGKAGAATRPALTLGASIIPRGSYQAFRDFDVKDNTGHTIDAFNLGALTLGPLIDGVYANDATLYPARFVSSGCAGTKIVRCKVLCAASTAAIVVTSASFTVEGCDLKNTSGKGIDTTGVDPLGLRIVRNLVRGCGGHGIVLDLGTGGSNRSAIVTGNTVDSCGSGFDGIRVIGWGDVASNLTVEDNTLSNNGGYGLNFTNAGATDGGLSGSGFVARNNDTYLNTSGAYKSATASYAYNACPWATGDPGANPTYTSGSDWTPTNAALQAAAAVAGYPTTGEARWIGAIPGPAPSGGGGPTYFAY